MRLPTFEHSLTDRESTHMASQTDDQRSAAGLFAPGAASSLSSYIERMWSLRHFMTATAKGRLTARNQGMVLGNVWLLLEPFLFVMVYYVIFELVLDVGRGTDNFILFLTVGRLAFGNHQQAVLGGSQSLLDNPGLVRESSMPKAVLPFGVAVSGFYQWRLDVVVIFLVALATGAFPRWSWLLIVPLSLGLFALNAAVALLLAPIVAEFGDLKRAMPVIFRLLFYTSGVMFPVEPFVEDLDNSNFFFGLLMLNPVYGYIKAMQWAIFGYDLGRPVVAIVVSVLWTVVLLPLAIWLFARRERTLGAFRFGVGA